MNEPRCEVAGGEHRKHCVTSKDYGIRAARPGGTFMVKRASAILGAAAILLAACAQTPAGPTVAVMPGPSKPFPVFQDDMAACKQYASQQVATQADEANKEAAGALILGAVLGAAIGAAAGHGSGDLAATGAGVGAAAGTGLGASNAEIKQISIQQQYNVAFSQCMYSRGNQVAGFAPAATVVPQPAVPAAPPSTPATN